MEFSVKSGHPEKQRTACLVVGVFEPRRMSPTAQRLDDATGGHLANLLRRGDIEGRRGQTLLLHNVPGLLADRVLLVGCGRERDLDDSRYREVISTATRTLHETGAMEAVSYLTELNVKGRNLAWRLRQAVESSEDTLYRFESYKSAAEQTRRPLRRIVLAVPSRRELALGERTVAEGAAVAAGVSMAKDLANTPPNVCNPEWLDAQANELAGQFDKVHHEALGRDDMEQLGMGAILAVSRGSRQEPRLIRLDYRGASEESKPVVLVGKGITFDSGGISIKPSAAMDEMKFDMGGAAAVIGTMRAVAQLGLPINVTALVAAAENMPDGNAMRPGDIITTLSGQTVEVLNTDAEGRLVLCDALTYSERLQPATVIDVATLTGACLVALGRHTSGLLSNHNPLANDLLAAGRESGDRAWELPLWDEYQEALKSNFADMANVGGREAGTITAACYLSRFTRKMRWAHLDIAGTAWQSGDKKGATGRPVPLLTQYLIDVSEAGT